MQERTANKRNCRRRPALVFLSGVALFTVALIANGQSQVPSLSEAADPSLQKLRALVSAGSFQQAESGARTYLELHEASAEARYLLAYILFRESHPKESLAEYTHAAKLRTPAAEDLRSVALDYVLLDDYPDADKWMSRSLVENDVDSEGWYALGRIRYTENRFQSAIACFQKALALSPGSVKAEDNLGLAYEGLNLTDDAIAAYRLAMAWQQDAPHPSEQPILNLGIVFEQKDQPQQALTLLLQAEQISPRDPKIHEHLGKVYLLQNDLPKAQAELEQATALAPNDAGLHFQLGQVYRRAGLTDKAKVEFARTAAINGTHSSAITHN